MWQNLSWKKNDMEKVAHKKDGIEDKNNTAEF